MSSAILEINNLPSSQKRDYHNCNNFICPLILLQMLNNINELLSSPNFQNIQVCKSQITFDIITSDSSEKIPCMICIYKSTSESNKHLIEIKLLKPVSNFGRFYSKIKSKILNQR